MNRFITLMPRNILYLVCLLSGSVCAQEINAESVIGAPTQEGNKLWEGVKKTWRDDIQFHGFLSQGLYVTSPASPVLAPARRYKPCTAKLKLLNA
jgi:hypothetical protein